MDMATVLREIEEWPVDDRVRLVEAVWNSLVDTDVQPSLTPAQKADLDRRLQALEAAPQDVVSREDVQRNAASPAAG